MNYLETALLSQSDTREVSVAVVKGLQVKVETLTSHLSGLETHLADAVKRWKMKEARTLKAVSASADAFGCAREHWVRNNDNEVLRLRAELGTTSAEDRKGTITEIGEATKDALHTVDEAVHSDRQESRS